MVNQNITLQDRISYNAYLAAREQANIQDAKYIDEQVKNEQEKCDHISVCLGWDGAFQYRNTSICNCLICGEVDPDSKYKQINATYYKCELYSHGEGYKSRIDKLLDLRKLAISILRTHPEFTNSDLVDYMTNLLKQPDYEMDIEIEEEYIHNALTKGQAFMNRFLDKLKHAELKIETLSQEDEEELTEEVIIKNLTEYERLLESGIIEKATNEGPVKRLMLGDSKYE